MKRILGIALMVLIATPAWAGIITFDSSATATRSWINGALNIAYDEINGSLDTDNLAAYAVTSDDIAAAANPLVRDAEEIGEFVYTGLLPPTASGLTSVTTAGTAYVLNDGDSTLHRVVKAATSKLYGTTDDTWVYLGFDGSYTYEPLANGAPQPTTPDNNILLAKVVTDGSDVTSVTDHRQLVPSNLRVYQDLKHGLVISRDVTTASTVLIGRGEIEFGGTAGKVRRLTSAASVNLAAAGRGGLDTGSLAASTYYYLHAVADDDNSTDWEGIASLSSSDATGVTGERLVGWCYSTSTSVISSDAVGAWRGRGGDAPSVYGAGQDNITLANAAKVALGLHRARVYFSNRPVRIDFQITASSSGATKFFGEVSMDGVQIEGSFVGQSLDNLGSTYSNLASSVLINPSEGEHYIDLVTTNTDAATANAIKGWSLVIQEL